MRRAKDKMGKLLWPTFAKGWTAWIYFCVSGRFAFNLNNSNISVPGESN
jgi:hypothetical protein